MEVPMDQTKNLILLKGKDKTFEIKSCNYNQHAAKYDVSFGEDHVYSYNSNSVEWIKNPETLTPSIYQISHKGKLLNHIKLLLEFCGSDTYWHIVFDNGRHKTYPKKTLKIRHSCLIEKEAQNKLAYLKDIANIGELKTDDGESLLYKTIKKLNFIDQDTVLSNYLYPEKYKIKNFEAGFLIFPFGGNASQFKAVEQSMSNQLSVIQGPPGTGKTQTILNIIANLLIREKTVQVVSNNNSAIENILEKLAAPQNNLDFLVATLGKRENKEQFLQKQTDTYPDISSWKQTSERMSILEKQIFSHSKELSASFSMQERLASAKHELQETSLEYKHFQDYCSDRQLTRPSRSYRRIIKSEQIIQLIQSFDDSLERKQKLSFWLKFRAAILYGLFEWKFTNQNPDDIISFLQNLFYFFKINELTDEIKELEKSLSIFNVKTKMDELKNWSMDYLKGFIYNKLGTNKIRKIFSKEQFWKTPEEILKEYPVVLSTTFSSRNSLKNVIYDYVIMDEASQVDIITGSLSLSCARNAVVVGDLQQLPNVVTEDIRKKADALFSTYHLPQGYVFADNSFLKSICIVFPDAPQTLLREHYRCHPQIIEFCNQKFYQNQLIIMTEDHGEKDILSVYKTILGNHQRGHISQRQIDIAVQEVLPKMTNFSPEEIDIIAPYRDQVKAISKALPNNHIEVDTVHKFQGREKKSIILMTVDNYITEFSDNPYLLNVAISRAKDKLCLITSGNEQSANSNIHDLIAYIQYHNFEIINSKIYSVFDLLYQQYTQQRIDFLRNHTRISEFDSENIMYGYLMDLLNEHPDLPLKVSCHHPLRQLIRDSRLLTEKEARYAFNINTHIDFFIYNHITKQPVLAIEVDGVKFHSENTKQYERDLLKKCILEKYEIPLLRLPTNGSNEIEKIKKALLIDK